MYWRLQEGLNAPLPQGIKAGHLEGQFNMKGTSKLRATLHSTEITRTKGCFQHLKESLGAWAPSKNISI